MKKVITFIITITIISVLILPHKVKATSLGQYVTINNTRMTGANSKYTGGGTVTVNIVNSGNSDSTKPIYGFVAICSALGGDSTRYITQWSSQLAEDMTIINSTQGCAIPNTEYYRDTSRVLYITFKLSGSDYFCNTPGTECSTPVPIDLIFTQPNSNVYSLISFGLGDEPFSFPDAINIQVNQNQQIIDQNDRMYNEDIDSTSKQDVNTNDVDNTTSQEDTLLNMTGSTNMTIVDVGIDLPTSNKIWEILTNILQQNAKVLQMVISILSIGIIKLILRR